MHPLGPALLSLLVAIAAAVLASICRGKARRAEARAEEAEKVAAAERMQHGLTRELLEAQQQDLVRLEQAALAAERRFLHAEGNFEAAKNAWRRTVEERDHDRFKMAQLGRDLAVARCGLAAAQGLVAAQAKALVPVVKA